MLGIERGADVPLRGLARPEGGRDRADDPQRVLVVVGEVIGDTRHP